MPADPRNLLVHVHPALAKVILAADQDPQKFIVTYGLRTEDEEAAAVASHHSQTMHSEHLASHGASRAVDLSPLDASGQAYFAPGREPLVYGMIAKQVLAAVTRVGLVDGDVMWGGALVGAWRSGVVSHFRDWGHFQLNPLKFL